MSCRERTTPGHPPCPCQYHVLEEIVKPHKTELKIRDLALKTDPCFPDLAVSIRCSVISSSIMHYIHSGLICDFSKYNSASSIYILKLSVCIFIMVSIKLKAENRLFKPGKFHKVVFSFATNYL